MWLLLLLPLLLFHKLLKTTKGNENVFHAHRLICSVKGIWEFVKGNINIALSLSLCVGKVEKVNKVFQHKS